jgi:hypothetical protein
MSYSTTIALALAATYAFLEVMSRGVITFRILRELGRLFVLFELAVYRMVRLFVRPKYVLTGSCHKCGDCCEQILGNPPRFVKDSKLLIALFVGWHRVVHNFHVNARGDDGEVIFRCGHLKGDGRCGIYRLRPFICRNYPVLPFYGPPQPLPSCGFGVAARTVTAMRERPSLRVLNAMVAVHHPTRQNRGGPDLPENYERVAQS